MYMHTHISIYLSIYIDTYIRCKDIFRHAYLYVHTCGFKLFPAGGIGMLAYTFMMASCVVDCFLCLFHFLGCMLRPLSGGCCVGLSSLPFLSVLR